MVADGCTYHGAAVGGGLVGREAQEGEGQGLAVLEVGPLDVSDAPGPLHRERREGERRGRSEVVRQWERSRTTTSSDTVKVTAEALHQGQLRLIMTYLYSNNLSYSFSILVPIPPTGPKLARAYSGASSLVSTRASSG